MSTIELDRKTRIAMAYEQAVYFTESGEPDGLVNEEADLSEDAVKHADAVAEAFLRCFPESSAPFEPEQLGHDLWLTRNGHGSGFWDREELYGDCGPRFTSFAENLGEAHAYTGDDGLIYIVTNTVGELWATYGEPERVAVYINGDVITVDFSEVI